MSQRIQPQPRTPPDPNQVLLAFSDTHEPASTAAPSPVGRESVQAKKPAAGPVSNPRPGPEANKDEDKSLRGRPTRARISFEAPLRLKRKLERMARDLDRSKTALLREAVEAYLRKLSEGEGDR